MKLAIAGGANGIFFLSTTALASPVNGALAHGYYALQKIADAPSAESRP